MPRGRVVQASVAGHCDRKSLQKSMKYEVKESQGYSKVACKRVDEKLE